MTSVRVLSYSGTDEERGLILWRKQMAPDSRPDGQQGAREPATSPYDIPWITPRLRQWKWTKYMPFLPTFQEGCSNNCCRGSNSDRPADVPTRSLPFRCHLARCWGQLSCEGAVRCYSALDLPFTLCLGSSSPSLLCNVEHSEMAGSVFS